MYTKDANVHSKPSLSSLKRKQAALKRAIARKKRISHMISLNDALAAQLDDLKYAARTK
jgi:hypothetical protein